MKKIYIYLVRSLLNFFDYFQQKKIISFFKKYLKNNHIIFFDIGSHYGETVKKFEKVLNVKEFHCFEASPKNFEILTKRIYQKDKIFKYHLNNLGLGNQNGEVFLNQTEESSSSTINKLNLNSKYLKRKLRILNISKQENYFKKIPIKLIKLDNYIEEKKIEMIDIIKIDTEGFEFNILKGLKKNFKKVKLIYFEHHYDDMILKEYSFSDIHNLIISHGFKKVFKSKMYFRKSFEYIYKNNLF